MRASLGLLSLLVSGVLSVPFNDAPAKRWDCCVCPAPGPGPGLPGAPYTQAANTVIVTLVSTSTVAGATSTIYPPAQTVTDTVTVAYQTQTTTVTQGLVTSFVTAPAPFVTVFVTTTLGGNPNGSPQALTTAPAPIVVVTVTIGPNGQPLSGPAATTTATTIVTAPFPISNGTISNGPTGTGGNPLSGPAATSTNNGTAAAQSSVATATQLTISPAATSTTNVATSTTSSAAPTATLVRAADGSPINGGVSILSTINKWRSAYGEPLLIWNSALEANAQKTGNDNGGVTENHELNPPSSAQVISPGVVNPPPSRDLAGLTPFELTYVAAWLCEVPTDPALGGNCPRYDQAAGIIIPQGETAHHDILTGAITQIGCAFARNPQADDNSFFSGIWVCDVNQQPQ